MRGNRWVFSAALAALLVLASGPFAWSAAQYAVAASSNTVYLLATGATAGSPGTVKSGVIQYRDDNNVLHSASGLGGLTVKGNLAYVTDQSSNRLHVLQLNNLDGANPSFSLLGSYVLTGLNRPGALSVDSTGGVFVTDAAPQSGQSSYAYVHTSGAWGSGSPSITISSITGATFGGVAAYGASSAIMAFKSDDGGTTAATWVASSSSGAAAATHRLDSEDTQPVGVAVHDFNGSSVAYIANSWARSAPESSVYGTLTTWDTATSALNSYSLADYSHAIPVDLAAGTITGANALSYITFIGEGSDGQKAWLVQVNGAGTPMMASMLTSALGTSEQVVGHHIAASPDGTAVWFTSPQSRTVQVWDPLHWDQDHALASFTGENFLDGVNYIAGVDVSAVPEPSSLVGLLGLMMGGLAAIRRRRN